MALIRNGELVEDRYQVVADDAPLPAAGDVVLSLARYHEEQAALARRPGKVGVRVPPDTPVHELGPLATRVDLIAVEFPSFTDGRGYSLARRLRTQYGFTGELRAVGDVLRDQLFYMRRCGFDAFEVKPGKDVREAIEAFRDFSVTYQGAADDPRPLFRRRSPPA